MKYAVSFTYNFDYESKTYLFKSYEEAVDFLSKLWKKVYDDEINEGAKVNHEKTYCEEQYAVVSWYSTTNEEGQCDKMEFFLGEVESPEDVFRKEDE